MKASVPRGFENKLIYSQKELIIQLLIAADKACINRIAIVGGFVRDEIIRINHPQTTNKIQDIDLVIDSIKSLFG